MFSKQGTYIRTSKVDERIRKINLDGPGDHPYSTPPHTNLTPRITTWSLAGRVVDLKQLINNMICQYSLFGINVIWHDMSCSSNSVRIVELYSRLECMHMLTYSLIYSPVLLFEEYWCTFNLFYHSKKGQMLTSSLGDEFWPFLASEMVFHVCINRCLYKKWHR